jgi:hypothetical protein
VGVKNQLVQKLRAVAGVQTFAEDLAQCLLEQIFPLIATTVAATRGALNEVFGPVLPAMLKALNPAAHSLYKLLDGGPRDWPMPTFVRMAPMSQGNLITSVALHAILLKQYGILDPGALISGRIPVVYAVGSPAIFWPTGIKVSKFHDSDDIVTFLSLGTRNGPDVTIVEVGDLFSENSPHDFAKLIESSKFARRIRKDLGLPEVAEEVDERIALEEELRRGQQRDRAREIAKAKARAKAARRREAEERVA